MQEGLKVGAKVFGLTMLNHVLCSQLYRTSFFQNYTGNVLIRDTALTSTVSFAIYSIPNVYNLLCNNISFGQFLKNTAVLSASILGGALGAAGLKAFGTRIGSAALGVGGGLIGGVLGAIGGTKIVKTAADIIREDDGEIFARLLTAIVSSMAVEYMFTEKEINKLSNRLKAINEADIKGLLTEYRHSSNQEDAIRAFLTPHFIKVSKSRRKLKKIKANRITASWKKLVEQ